MAEIVASVIASIPNDKWLQKDAASASGEIITGWWSPLWAEVCKNFPCGGEVIGKSGRIVSLDSRRQQVCANINRLEPAFRTFRENHLAPGARIIALAVARAWFVLVQDRYFACRPIEGMALFDSVRLDWRNGFVFAHLARHHRDPDFAEAIERLQDALMASLMMVDEMHSKTTC